MNQESARRVVISTVAALATAVIAIQFHAANPLAVSDFGQVWAAARGWRQGLDPYAVVGPGLPFPWRFPLVYPLTAVIAAWPFSFLPLSVADPLFVALSIGALTWALTCALQRRPLCGSSPRFLSCMSFKLLSGPRF